MKSKTHQNLMHAAQSIKAVTAMLELGYDINEKDEKGLTILDKIYHRKTRFKYSEEYLKSLDDLIEWLKKKGAKVGGDL